VPAVTSWGRRWGTSDSLVGPQSAQIKMEKKSEISTNQDGKKERNTNSLANRTLQPPSSGVPIVEHGKVYAHDRERRGCWWASAFRIPFWTNEFDLKFTSAHPAIPHSINQRRARQTTGECGRPLRLVLSGERNREDPPKNKKKSGLGQRERKKHAP
jgi:hypothetical protein